MSGLIASANRSDRSSAALGAAVAALAVLALLSSLTQPPADGRGPALSTALWVVLLVAHSTLYFASSIVQRRAGLPWYVAAQTLLVFAIGLEPSHLAVTVAVIVAWTSQAVRELRGSYSAMTVALAGVVVFCASTTISGGLYRGATVALILTALGVIMRALMTKTEQEQEKPVEALAVPRTDSQQLTERELQVLRLAASGQRSREIAGALAISERTVKAHLATAYRKFGVETRAAAVAEAARRGLLDD